MSAESDEQPVEEGVPEAAGAELEPQPEPQVEMPAAEAAPNDVTPAPEPSPVVMAESEETPVSESEGEVAETSAPATPKKSRRKALHAPGKNKQSLQYVTARFAACGRCSYFWAGYRILHGEQALETAVAESHSGWLDLEWDGGLPELLHKSYGVRLDIEHWRYEGCCQECRRHFIYQVTEEETEADQFLIEITPQRAK